MKEKKPGTVLCCPQCKEFIVIGQEHECYVMLVDLDSGKYDVREARVKTSFEWK